MSYTEAKILEKHDKRIDDLEDFAGIILTRIEKIEKHLGEENKDEENEEE